MRFAEVWPWCVAVMLLITSIPANGMSLAFGVIFPFIHEEFNVSAAATSWIGAALYGFIMGFHFATVPLIQRFRNSLMLMIGSVLLSGGLIMASFAPNYAVMFIGFSLLYGIGLNIMVNCTVVIMKKYFKGSHHYSAAFSLSLVSWPGGGLVMNPVLDILTETLGWRNALRVLAGTLAIILSAQVLIYWRGSIIYRNHMLALKPVSTEDLDRQEIAEVMLDKQKHAEGKGLQNQLKILKSLAKDPLTWIWNAEGLMEYCGILIPFVHLINYLEMQGVPSIKGALVITILGSVECCSRIVSGSLASYFKFHMMYYSPVLDLLLCISTAMLTKVSTFYHAAAFGAVYGMALGPVLVSHYLTTAGLFKEKTDIAWIIFGLTATVGSLIGSPMAGVILDVSDSYISAFLMGGGIYFIASVMALVKCIIFYRSNRTPPKLAVIYKKGRRNTESKLLVNEIESVI